MAVIRLYARIAGMRVVSRRQTICVLTLLAICFASPSPAQSPAKSPNSPSDDSAKSSERVYYLGQDGVSLPSCFYSPSPPYTAEARAARFQGNVLAEGSVTVDGRIMNPRILKSPGMGLDDSVLKTLKKWRCKPGTKDAKPVPTIVPFQISFRLNGGS